MNLSCTVVSACQVWSRCSLLALVPWLCMAVGVAFYISVVLHLPQNEEPGRCTSEPLRRRDSPLLAISVSQANTPTPINRPGLNFTPRRGMTPASTCSTPGITPSPCDRPNSRLLSPMAVSPCGAVLFTDSPTPQPNEKVRLL